MVLTKREKMLMRKAYEHGKSVATYTMSSLPERYAPYTYESWLILLEEKLKNDPQQTLELNLEK